MLVKTILNSIDHFKSFVFDATRWETVDRVRDLVVKLRAQANSRPECSCCCRRSPVYDMQRARLYNYVPLWGFPVYFRYATRRVSCPVDVVRVEQVPWAEEKERMTFTYHIFLARWAKRLSWKETAEVFRTSWDSVYRAVRFVVEYGLAHRDIDRVESIGIYKIQVFHGHTYTALLYQIDEFARRLLWYSAERTRKRCSGFLRQWGEDRCFLLKSVCSDMWAHYLKIVRKKAPQALHVLDRFHIMKKFGEAIDHIRREEVKKLKSSGQENVLGKSRRVLFKRLENPTKNRPSGLMRCSRSTLLREDFQQFWEYTNPACATRFPDDWITRTLKTKLVSIKKAASMLRYHKQLILNWFATEKKGIQRLRGGLQSESEIDHEKSV